MDKKLSKTERQILANQFRILAHLEESQQYELKAEILERGYAAEYWRVFNARDEDVPEDVVVETADILTMFRRIEGKISQLSEEERGALDLDRLHFEGFDANHDQHFGYLTFAIEKLGLWEEYRGKYINSHSQIPLMRYRKMLEYEQTEIRDRGNSTGYPYELDDLVKLSKVI